MRPKGNFVYAIHDISGLTLLTSFRLSFSNLNEHKFRHNFKNFINSMFFCNFELETTDHYLVHYKLFSNVRKGLLNDMFAMNQSLKNSLKI